MSRRRRRQQHPENHERWLVSYADFITLLFAFFVVMYSVSSVNEGKFRVLADSLFASFSDRGRSLEPIQVGKLVRSPIDDRMSLRKSPLALQVEVIPEHYHKPGEGDGEGGVPAPVPGDSAQAAQAQEAPAGAGDAARERMAHIDEVAARLREEVQPLIEEGTVAVRRGEQWLEVEFNTSILFASGQARLSEEASELLGRIAGMLGDLPNPIHVEGFTDDVPIATAIYPSNWELSAARAASVVHLFTQRGIEPHRMAAIGYGEHRPVADNATEEGRRRNRRVVVVIPAQHEDRRELELERLAAAPGPRPEAMPR